MRQHITIMAAVALALTAACAPAESTDGNASQLQDARTDTAGQVAMAAGELVPLRVGGHEIMVEIADDAQERAQGLMHRESLPRDQGMLFVYPSPRSLSFWMRNTLIPLDIAFIDAGGRIIDIQQMQPQSDEYHVSSAPALMALEMNEGWFATNGIQVGALVEY